MHDEGQIYAAAPGTADFRLKTLDFGLPQSVVRSESHRLQEIPATWLTQELAASLWQTAANS